MAKLKIEGRLEAVMHEVLLDPAATPYAIRQRVQEKYGEDMTKETVQALRTRFLQTARFLQARGLTTRRLVPDKS